MSEEKIRWRLSRRNFLIGIGAAGALALGFRVGRPRIRRTIAGNFADSEVPFGIYVGPTAWFEITPDNQVRLLMPKAEMGQGIHTALAQIAAEELEIEWSQLDVVQVGAGAGLDDAGLTGASNSVSTLYSHLREGAAILRELLRAEAAHRFDVAVSDVAAAAGRVHLRFDPERGYTYGELIQNAANWDVPTEPPPLKPSSQFRFIGQSMPRIDLPDKVIGKAIYGYDMRVPNMLYGAVARPQTIDGKLRNASAGTASDVDGVIQVVIQEGFAGVVATTRAQAYAGLQALDLEWDEASQLQQADLDAMVTVGQGTGTVVQKAGDVDSQLQGGELIQADYRTPMAVHVPMEPQAALADVQADQVQIWTSTQYPLGVRNLVAEALERDAEQIAVTPTYLGGGFGRKLGTEAEVAVEAAILSAAAGRPVHVGWNRTEEIQNGYFRPPTHHQLQGRIGADGNVVAMAHQQASSDVVFFFLPPLAPLIMGADFGAWRGALIPYDIPHKEVTAWHVDLPCPTGWWRGLGLLANIFAVESFMDELAHAAGVDPVQFRLQHLGEDKRSIRYKRVLQTVAERSGWAEPLPSGRARGVAVSADVKTLVAEVAEVSVDEATNQIRVHKITAVVDPGLIINPDGATAQVQGAILMGLGSTLHEEITIKDGRIEATNFDRYPLLSMTETPEIDVLLLESGEEPFGIGEPPIGPVAAAVSNAVFALTRQRLRQLPLRLT